MSDRSWSDEENDLIVAEYFAMLEKDIAGVPYNKAARNRDLQARIGRGRGSIEYKHQNLSAVMKGLGEPWILGYKPAFNFQGALVEAVSRYLHSKPDWWEVTTPSSTGFADAQSIWMSTPPTLSNAPPPDETEQMARIAIHFDVSGRDERNRALGEAGEALVLSSERAKLANNGRADLAEQVRWVSRQDGDGAGFDIASFELDGRDKLIEVKTTNGWERTPFHISRNEIAVSQEREAHWCLVRVWNFAREPRGFELKPPLERHVSLMPTSFRASFH